MAPLDASAPLPDISAESPAGANLEFDPEFTELERLAQGKPEQQYGSTIVPAEEPEWKQVVAAANALCERTYDLRVLAQLAVARLQLEGPPGYAETLTLIRQLLETRWADVHPQLDPEDDNDPTLRANALLAIAEPLRVLRVLRLMPLARSVRAGAVCWRDIAIATGQIEVDAETPKVGEATIAAAFRETDRDKFQTLVAAIETAVDDAAAIPAAFEASAGYGTGPDFTELLKLLRDIKRILAQNAPSDAAASPDDAPEPPASEPADGARFAAVPSARPILSIAAMGPPTNRADALRLLDLASAYFTASEPSSPLPLLIARAIRLADKSFLDILRDMAPDGVDQAQKIAGVTDY